MSEYHNEKAFRDRLEQRVQHPVTPSPFAVFYHAALLPDFAPIVAEQMMVFRACGLRAIKSFVLGGDAEFRRFRQISTHYGIEAEVVGRHPDVRQFERPTLQKVYEWATANPTGAVLYCHTKGGGSPHDQHKVQWRRVMMRHVVVEWKRNLEFLQRADLVGCAWQTNHDYPHFCGNFWLARNDWLASLPSPDTYRESRPDFSWAGAHSWKERMYPETWIGAQPWHHVHDLIGMNRQLWNDDVWNHSTTFGAVTYREPLYTGDGNMMTSILEWLKTKKDELRPKVGRVLEVGSQDINGSPRSVFEKAAKTYLGIDVEEGDGVDVVLDAEKLSSKYKAGTFDTVICCETLEHCVRPWVVVEQMKKVLKKGGLLWITTPTFGFPHHAHPIDCYRFGEDAYRLWLFADMTLLALDTVRDHLNQPALVAVGRKK